MCTAISEVFVLVPAPQKVSIDRDLKFHIHIGIHLRKMCQKFVYYYLYNEEWSFPLDTCPRFFYLVLLTNCYKPFIQIKEVTFFGQSCCSWIGCNHRVLVNKYKSKLGLTSTCPTIRTGVLSESILLCWFQTILSLYLVD